MINTVSEKNLPPETATYTIIYIFIFIHTYKQCAAVRTHRELIREPPHKKELSILRAACHGNWQGAAIIPSGRMWYLSPSCTSAFPV
jgi:hypothetical protein